MKNFIEKHPVWFAIGLTVLITVLGLVIVVGSRALGFSQEALTLTVLVFSAAVPLGFIWWLGWWEDAGFVSTTHNTSALAIPLISTLIPLMLYGAIANEARIVSYYIVAMFLVGLGEDALSRGLFVRAFLPHGKWQAVFIPSLIFGASHITQLLGNDMALKDNLVQMVNAFMVGSLVAAVRLRINNIWPLIIIHAFYDFFHGVAGFGGPNGIHTIADIPLPIYLVSWLVYLVTIVYTMNKPLTATIDGKPVGTMNKPFAAPRAESQSAD